MKIKKAYAIVLSSAFVLCACSTPKPEPTIPTYTVVLQAGEEASFGDKSYLILNNIPEGTMLNQVTGYKLPTHDNPFLVFNYWLDDEGSSVKVTTPIVSNIQLTASYINGPKYYVDLLNKDKTKYCDYGVNRQYQYEFDERINEIIDQATNVLLNEHDVSPLLASKIYRITSFALTTLNQIDVASGRNIGDPDGQYRYITNAHNDCLSVITSAKQDKLDEIQELSEIYIGGYNAYDISLMEDLYQELSNEIKDADSSLDLYTASKLNNGFLRDAYSINGRSQYDFARAMTEMKLLETKETVRGEDKLLQLIDCLGDYASSFDRSEPNHLNEMYGEILNLATNNTILYVNQKMQMLLSLMKAKAYAKADLAIENELDLFNHVEPILNDNNVNDITEIIVHGAKALQRCNEHGSYCDQFVNSTIKTAIEYYNEQPDFLDCILYAMDAAGNLGDLVQEDIFVKEYETENFMSQHYFNYTKVNAPFAVAYDFYKDHINQIPEINIPAFKIVINGIIGGCLYGCVDPSHFITLFSDESNYGLVGIKELPSSIVEGYAYACAGFACMFANAFGTMSSGDEEFIYDKFTSDGCHSIFFGCANALKDCRYKHIADFVGQAIGLCWQNIFVWTAQPFCGVGDRAAAYNTGKNYATKWQNRIENMIPYLSNDTISVIKNAIMATLTSSRFTHYYVGPEDKFPLLDRFRIHNTELQDDNGYLDKLFSLIFDSYTLTQLITRFEIYTDSFVKEVDRQNNDENYKENLEELYNQTKALMEEV